MHRLFESLLYTLGFLTIQCFESASSFSVPKQLNPLPQLITRPVTLSPAHQPLDTSFTLSMNNLSRTRGGGDGGAGRNILSHPTGTQATYSRGQKALASWAVFSVLAFIGSAVKRLVPVALEPVLKGGLSSEQSLIYAAWVVVMMYVEGYKSFHLKFSPLVVRRAFLLTEQPSILKSLFAGPYAMGLVGANKKRTIVSWSIVGGVMLLVQLVKRLEYPW